MADDYVYNEFVPDVHFELIPIKMLVSNQTYQRPIHVMVAQRNAGKVFSLENHIAGLVYAQLTNQTKWSRIVPHLKKIDALFFHYDPQRIKEKDSRR